MRRGQEREREIIMKDLQKNFVFYVPNAGSQKPLLFPKSRSELDEDKIKKTLGGEVDLSGHNSNALFFPDKKLIQFDAGKLQILSELLRNLKQGKHRVLIFTQMSKMLDILEAFLNLNGHTYVRLDGATSVDQRQRLMDRFNHDEKIFVFILSTRSGGLGINLTGADTVVFYDSDWNPAMDAQAQVSIRIHHR
jgi:SNF2 family DNA or RNA helicase